MGRKNVLESGECRLNLDCVSGRSITNKRFVVVRTVISALLPAQAKEFIKTLLRRATPRWMTRAQEQRAEQRFAAGKRPISEDKIRADLQALPLPSETVVFMHSSMSRLGYVEGGAATIATALYEVIVRNRNSTLAVPTFTMTGGMADTLRAGGVFDLRTTPSVTGRITETIRQYPGAVRSLHPTHSVAALGPRAEWLTEAHHRDIHSFGAISPFGRLIEADGFVLGLGIDLGPVTFVHTVEDLSNFPIPIYTADSPISAVCRDGHGRAVEVKVMAHDPAASGTRIDRPNGAAIRSYMTAVFEYFGDLKWYKIGDGRMWLISAHRYYDCLEQLKERGITIYATADEVASFPPPTSVLDRSQENFGA
jgi:aminoglycoside 3-N-acetyltransferase